MSIVVNIYYSGENGSARKFAKEMISSGTVDAIRNEAGNIRYDYFFPLGDEETVLLIDSWENQESIDFHHQSPMMNKIAELRDKYNLHMKVERYRSEDTIPESSPNLCVNYFFSRALVVQGMPLHPCLCTSTLEGAVKGAPLRTSKRFP